ncbi:hypothetical protein IAT40_002409 [Kwoniella sp. CBS 6097]
MSSKTPTKHSSIPASESDAVRRMISGASIRLSRAGSIGLDGTATGTKVPVVTIDFLGSSTPSPEPSLARIRQETGDGRCYTLWVGDEIIDERTGTRSFLPRYNENSTPEVSPPPGRAVDSTGVPTDLQDVGPIERFKLVDNLARVGSQDGTAHTVASDQARSQHEDPQQQASATPTLTHTGEKTMLFPIDDGQGGDSIYNLSLDGHPEEMSNTGTPGHEVAFTYEGSISWCEDLRPTSETVTHNPSRSRRAFTIEPRRPLFACGRRRRFA